MSRRRKTVGRPRSNAGQKHRLRVKDEWTAMERFQTLDVDGNGEASVVELHAFLLSEGYDDAFITSFFRAVDRNGDGRVSAEEWRTGVSLLQQARPPMRRLTPTAMRPRP